MTLGQADRQGDLLDDVTRFCDEALSESSIYAVLYRERDRLFPDEMFADLFSDKGRRSVPPSVMVPAAVLISMPGIGIRTGARILLDVGDGTAFATSAPLAAYAGLAPVTRRSG